MLSITVLCTTKITYAEPKLHNHTLRGLKRTSGPSFVNDNADDKILLSGASLTTASRDARTLKRMNKEKQSSKNMKDDKKEKKEKENAHKMKVPSNAETKTKSKNGHKKANKKSKTTSSKKSGKSGKKTGKKGANWSKSGKKSKKGKSSLPPPTAMPTDLPTETPTLSPTLAPSFVPSDAPSLVPSVAPSSMPSDMPSLVPSSGPTVSWENQLIVCLCNDVNSCLATPVAPLDETSEFRFCITLPDEANVGALWIDDLKLTRHGLYSENLVQDESTVPDRGVVECAITGCVVIAPLSPELFIAGDSASRVSEIVAEGTVGIETLASEQKLVDFSHPFEVLVTEEEPSIVVEKDAVSPQDNDGYGNGSGRGFFVAFGVAVALLASGGLVHYYRKIHEANMD